MSSNLNNMEPYFSVSTIRIKPGKAAEVRSNFSSISPPPSLSLSLPP